MTEYHSQHTGNAIDNVVAQVQAVGLNNLLHNMGLYGDLGTRPAGRQTGDYCYVGTSMDATEYVWNGTSWAENEQHVNLTGRPMSLGIYTSAAQLPYQNLHTGDYAFVGTDMTSMAVYVYGTLTWADSGIRVNLSIPRATPIQQQTLSTAAIYADVMNVWNAAVQGLNITLVAPSDSNDLHEYLLEFETGEVVSSINVTPAVDWMNDPDLEPYHRYQISIMNGIAIMGGIELEQEDE